MKSQHPARFMMILGAMLWLTSCANQTADTAAKKQVNSQSLSTPNQNAHALHDQSNTYGTGDGKALNDPTLIPSYHGPKTSTTNQHGQTTGGMGMSVYSTIGSSGLHEGGISSHLQSRLNGQGIDGVNVLVLDDTVVLAREKEEISSNQYDDLQRKVLGHTEGMSGKGVQADSTQGNQGQTFDSIENARKQINEMFNGNVRVLTVTDPKATALMDRIKSELHNAASSKALSDDIAALLKLSK